MTVAVSPFGVPISHSGHNPSDVQPLNRQKVSASAQQAQQMIAGGEQTWATRAAPHKSLYIICKFSPMANPAFRWEPQTQTIYFWDRALKVEIPVTISALLAIR